MPGFEQMPDSFKHRVKNHLQEIDVKVSIQINTVHTLTCDIFPKQIPLTNLQFMLFVYCVHILQNSIVQSFLYLLQETSKPIMCCYKLVTCEFIWWGLQGRVESLIQKVTICPPLLCVLMTLLNSWHKYLCICNCLSYGLACTHVCL